MHKAPIARDASGPQFGGSSFVPSSSMRELGSHMILGIRSVMESIHHVLSVVSPHETPIGMVCYIYVLSFLFPCCTLKFVFLNCFIFVM